MSIDQIFIVMANRVAELEASIPEHLAAGRSIAADMALYGARELRNILDLTAGPRWPVWVAEQRIAEPSASADPDVSVFYREDGWTLSGSPEVQACTSNYVPEREGMPPCTATAVWKVVEQHPMHLTVGFWCDADLPAEHRDLAQNVTA